MMIFAILCYVTVMHVIFYFKIPREDSVMRWVVFIFNGICGLLAIEAVYTR